MRVSIGFWFLTAAVAVTAFAAAGDRARADSSALDPKQVAAIDKLARAEVEEKRTPSIAVAVVRGDTIVYEKAFGLRDVAHGLPATPQTVYAIGSITKQMTAAGILLLARDGKLSLDDSLAKYVPEFALADRVTLRELLNQTSGLPSYIPAATDDSYVSKPTSLAEHLSVAASRQMNSEPGSRFEYNNLNYFLLGEVIERVAKEPYATFMHDRIFAQLNMRSTTYYFAGIPESRRAIGYSGKASALRPARVWDASWALGAGAITSTVHDLALWDIGFAGLLGDAQTAQMFAVPTNTSQPTEYGMGWLLEKRYGRAFVWHNGEIGGFHAMNAWYPDQKIHVIVLTNVDSLVSTDVVQPETIAQQIASEVMPSDTVSADPRVVARAKEWLGRLARGDIDRAQLTPAMAAALTPEAIQSVDVASFGPLIKLTPTAIDTQGGITIYTFRASFENNAYGFIFALDADNKIAGMRILP